MRLVELGPLSAFRAYDKGLPVVDSSGWTFWQKNGKFYAIQTGERNPFIQPSPPDFRNPPYKIPRKCWYA